MEDTTLDNSAEQQARVAAGASKETEMYAILD